MSDNDLTQWWAAYDDPAGSAPPTDAWDAALVTALDPASDVDFALYESVPAEVAGVTADDLPTDSLPDHMDTDHTDTGTAAWDDSLPETDLSVTLDDDLPGSDDDWPDVDPLDSDPLDTDPLDDSLDDF
ncbi:MAG: hypothetical protein WAW85_07135 [Gordonia sp. (in: high G+C Gram-positive bacteria)]|uniref:hypothetical protein n=1 Tax=Gordonia sp. (in: high G+C Gram-positive bacteria) TaxID=84139 RepID=UPI003BB5CC92